MDVNVESSGVISVSSSRLKVTEVSLSIFDRFATNVHIAVIYAFKGPTATNASLKEGLAEVLVHFPTLAGRFGEDARGRPCILVGDGGDGALVVEATVASELEDILPLEPRRDMGLLHPPADAPVHLLQIQLNRFRCGGLVVGLSAHHHVADGQSMGAFCAAWGAAVRGLAVDPLPIIDDRPWLKSRNPPRCEFDHWGVQFTRHPPPLPEGEVEPDGMTNICLRYSRDFINDKLKSGDVKEGRYTTFETLLGHVWRKLTIARGVPHHELTSARVAVNGRRRLSPAVPDEFFGNMVLFTQPQATAGDLIDGGIAGAAKLIHDGVVRTDERYFLSFIDFGELYGDEELVACYDLEGMEMCPDLEVDSWMGFSFQEVDFGGDGGVPCTFLPSWIPVEGVIILIPAPPTPGEKGGGVNVIVTLFEEHEKVLREISHTLD